MKLCWTAGLLPALILAGCAQKPESIAPAYVSPMTYSSYSCEQLGSEAVRVDGALARASAQQNDARQSDTIGVILLGLPVSSLSGGNVADQVANLKGQKDTIEQTQIAMNCLRMMSAPVVQANLPVAPMAVTPAIPPTPSPVQTQPLVSASPPVIAAPVATPSPSSGLTLPPVPTQTEQLPGHRVAGYGCPGFAPRVLYAESPDKLPRACERMEPL